MRKFKGQINGVEYTDMEEFEAAYRLMQVTSKPTDSVNVSYTVEYVDETQQHEPEKVETIKIDSSVDLSKLSDEEGSTLCTTADIIRDIVDETSNRIQSYIDAKEQNHRKTRELDTIIDAALTKINWLVQSLPGNLRRILCSSVYKPTEEMVDKINSELVDMRYELSKDQELISEEIRGIESEMKDLDNEMSELENRRNDLYRRMNDNQDEYDSNGMKIETIGVSKRFFDGLLASFSL